MAKRETQEINAGSMADIAFLLLIFFLVTTTMDQDVGILRQLPPPVPPDMPPPPKVIDRNVYEVLVNSNNQLLVEGEPMGIENLKRGAMDFYTNPQNNPDLPELRRVTRASVQERINQIKAVLAEQPNSKSAQEQLENWQDKLEAIRLVGEYNELPSSALISLQNDRGTSYEMYIKVQNELSAAVNQLRDNLSEEKFGVKYSELDPTNDLDKPKILAVRAVFPQRISEAEPKNTGN